VSEKVERVVPNAFAGRHRLGDKTIHLQFGAILHPFGKKCCQYYFPREVDFLWNRRRYLAAEPQHFANALRTTRFTWVDRLLRRRWLTKSPEAQISGGKAATISQRVEDNAFHLVGAS